MPATHNISHNAPRLPRLCLALLAILSIQAPLWADSLLATVPVGKSPGPIVVNPSGHLVYVVNQSANSVSVIDSDKLNVTKLIPVGKSPIAIAANPVANLVYVANSGDGTISAITGTASVATWTTGGSPVALVVDSVLSKVFVADATQHQVEILDATKGTLLATIPTGLQPNAITLNIATHDVWVACTSGAAGSVVVIDGTANALLTTVSGASIPSGITSISVDPATNVAIVASPTGPAASALATIDGSNGYAVTDEPSGNTQPYATAYDPGGLFFASFYNAADVDFCAGDGLFLFGNDYFSNTLDMTSLAVNPTTNQMATATPLGNNVSLFDLTNPIFTIYEHVLQTGNDPTEMAFDPLTSRFFVTNTGDNTVSVYDVSPRFELPAYEGSYNGNTISYNYVDVNPATGNGYTLRLGNLFAINEAAAAAGYTSGPNNSSGVTTIALGSTYSSAIAVNPATNKIYVGDDEGLFYSINGATNVATALNVLPSTSSIRSLAVNSAADQILAWDYSSGSIFVLDSATDTLLKTIALSQSSQASVVVDPTKDLAYVASNTFSVIDPTAGTVVTSFPLSGVTISAAINPAQKRCYVVTSGGDLYVIDTTSNTIADTITLPNAIYSLAVNPVTGNYYVAFDDTSNVTHVQIYNGSTNALIADLLGSTYPEFGDAADIRVNPLTDTVYVGGDSGESSHGIAAIDGRTNAVSAVTINPYEGAAHALKVDLGSNILFGAGFSYTTLWYPTSDITAQQSVPISVTITGVKDSSTISTAPLFRTTSTKPSFKISATSNFSANASALVPKHAFCQIDGWQGTWTPVNLTAQSGGTTSQVTVKLPAAIATGQHIIYCYASTGDVATIQDSIAGTNTATISPVGAVVFTVEK